MRLALSSLIVLATSLNAAAGPLTESERQRLVARLEMTSSWLIDEVSGLSATQLQFRPAPDAWSIMDVLDHLVVVGPIYWRDLQNAIKGPPSARAKTNTDADILWYGIDRTYREKAVPSELPKRQVRGLSDALDSYRKQHAQLMQYVRTTDDDLRARIVERQGSDAYQWALLISTHEQRHILQIREIKRHSRFP
jgi:uncharacterized damage-inducible protein DinB